MSLDDPTAPSRPEPASSIPQYIVDGLDRQGAETLRAIADYALELASYLERPITDEDLVDDGEELVDVDESSSGTVVRKKVPCGKDCNGCPHGPYEYLVSRNGDKIEWEYIGKA